jgi:octanoyl-[GcvH]:protein N-octanoyltransferase
MASVTDSRRILVAGSPPGRSAIGELTLPALAVRQRDASWDELVHLYVPQHPVVAFSARDLRSPGIRTATTIATGAAFAAVVRSPGGRMVAYDEGAVVIDHLTRSGDGLSLAGRTTFADNAAAHARVLREVLGLDARVGEVDGEYCPGEFSVNVGGDAKVIGSAQRITGTGALFSTVVQVSVPAQVRSVIAAVSDALGYELRRSSIGAIEDFAPGTTPDDVLAALAADYRDRLGLGEGEVPVDLVAAAEHADASAYPSPFPTNDWARDIS